MKGEEAPALLTFLLFCLFTLEIFLYLYYDRHDCEATYFIFSV